MAKKKTQRRGLLRPGKIIWLGSTDPSYLYMFMLCPAFIRVCGTKLCNSTSHCPSCFPPRIIRSVVGLGHVRIAASSYGARLSIRISEGGGAKDKWGGKECWFVKVRTSFWPLGPFRGKQFGILGLTAQYVPRIFDSHSLGLLVLLIKFT